MNLTLPSFVPGMALALAIGLLIGFERGWQQRDEAAGHRVAGVRTFALLGLLGGLAGTASMEPLRWLAAIIVVGAVAALLIAHAIDMRHEQTVSATGAIAALVTLLLGALASTGHPALAAVSAAAVVALLAARAQLHGLLRQTSQADVRALVRLVLVIFLVLPLLPDVGVGPFDSLNPRRLWLIVVIIAAISFGSYALIRWLGESHGGLLGAALGALVSSTAVTIACAQAMKRNEGAGNQVGIAVASVVMLCRAVTLVAILAPRALEIVVLLIGPALVVAAVAAAAMAWRSASHAGIAAPAPPRPPGISVALLFAGLVAIVSVLAAWMKSELGSGGATTAIAIGGMIDIDAAIAAIGMLPAEAISPQLAALAIAAPVAANSLLKLGLTVGIAGWKASRWATAALLAPVVAISLSAAWVFL